MMIQHISIRNFRGIKELNWILNNNLICIIGPGDSTKTTILDAIEMCLTTQWNPSFDASDFFNCDPKNTIEIQVTILNPPEELMSDQRFGLNLRYWDPEKKSLEEPPTRDIKNENLAITVQLNVDESLEPTWYVIDKRNEPKEISNKQREKFGISRIGNNIDRHLGWGKGSSLNRITQDSQSAHSLLVDSQRLIKENIKINELPAYKTISEVINKAGSAFGVKLKNELNPIIDTKSISLSFGSITLADGSIPIRMVGYGSKKLLALAIQVESVSNGAIILMDEIEQGLEPHRIRNLLRRIKEKSIGQILMTSHSSTVISELGSEFICIARCNDGKTELIGPSNDLQGSIRRTPDALLGKKIIVCEGPTEIGFLKSIENYWLKIRGKYSIIYEGVVAINGEGSSSKQRAIDFSRLGYSVAVLMDSDNKPDIESFEKSGIKQAIWPGNYSIEERTILDIPFDSLQPIIDLAIPVKEPNSVLDTINSFNNNIPKNNSQVSVWLSLGISENDIKTAIGKAAKKGDWFKSESLGESFGNIVIDKLDEIKGSETYKTIELLFKWIYEE